MGLLDGKSAIVTGGGKGLGRDIARLLHAEGARVAILGRSQETLDVTARMIGENILPIAVELGDAAGVEDAFARIERAFGSIDLLVNNAAVINTGSFEKMSVSDLSYAVSTNLLGVMLCCRFALPLLRKAGGGDIINVSSETAVYAAPCLAAYIGSKAGVEGFSRALAQEHRAENIRISVARLGILNDTEYPPDLTDFLRLVNQEGQAWILGAGFDRQASARTILHMATTPRDVNLTLVEMRPTGQA